MITIHKKFERGALCDKRKWEDALCVRIDKVNCPRCLEIWESLPNKTEKAYKRVISAAQRKFLNEAPKRIRDEKKVIQESVKAYNKELRRIAEVKKVLQSEKTNKKLVSVKKAQEKRGI